MSSQAVHPSLVLTRRLENGTIEWIPLTVPQHEVAATGGSYALIDRSTSFTAPPLVARRVGEDLVVEVDAAEVLILENFFATEGVAFYPTPDIASGGGPFSGPPLDPQAPGLTDASASTEVVWTAEPSSDVLPNAGQAPDADAETEGVNKAALWGGIGLGVLALGAAAGGGGGGGGSSRAPVVDPGVGTSPPDTTAPQITSGATAGPIDENSGAGQVVYRAIATDAGRVTFSLEGADALAFTINATNGEVIFDGNPDFEVQSSYNFTVVATDAAGNSSPQAVVLAINNTDDVAPTITSGAIAPAIDENSGAGQVVYTADSDSAVTWSLLAGSDAADFTIDANSGSVRLTVNPDEESKSDYNFTVIATDPTGNTSQQAVSLGINDLDEVAPIITSDGTASSIDENSGSGQVVYTVTSTDTGDVNTGSTTYSLRPGNDSADFSINPSTGAVTLIENPDFEMQPNYNFIVAATDAAGNSTERAISLTINNADDNQPTVTSVVLTSATGAQNNTLNAGDRVQVTVTMSENVTVDTTGGTPRIALNIGGNIAFADFESGSGTSNLNFTYLVQAGDADSNGISLASNSLANNGGTFTDAASNAANLNHAAVPDNATFLVDTSTPELTSSTPADGATATAVENNIELSFNENVRAGSGNITISNGTDTRVIDVTDATQVSISGDRVTINPAADLNPNSSYNVQIEQSAFTDAAGNNYAGISNTTTLNFETERVVNTSIVVFDLVQGTSSDHSDRKFDKDVSYDIYIRVNSNDAALSTSGDGAGTWGRWGDTKNLGSDDRIILVGNGAPVDGRVGSVTEVLIDDADVSWQTSAGNPAVVVQERSVARFGPVSDSVARLFDRDLPAEFLEGQEGVLNTMYFTSMPAGVLTSQGLG